MDRDMIRERGERTIGTEGEMERGKAGEKQDEVEEATYYMLGAHPQRDQGNKAADTPLLAGLCQWTLVTLSLTFAPSFSSREAAREMYSLNLNRSHSLGFLMAIPLFTNCAFSWMVFVPPCIVLSWSLRVTSRPDRASPVNTKHTRHVTQDGTDHLTFPSLFLY